MGVEMLRCAQHDRTVLLPRQRSESVPLAPSCHPERSEGAGWVGVEMLRCTQHDRAVLLPRHRHLRAYRLLSPPSPQQHLMGFS